MGEKGRNTQKTALKNCRSLRKTLNLLWRQSFRAAEDTCHLCPTLLHLFLIFLWHCQLPSWKGSRNWKNTNCLRGWSLPSFHHGVFSLGIDLNNNHKQSGLSMVYPLPATTTSPAILDSTGTPAFPPDFPRQMNPTTTLYNPALLQPYIPLVTIWRGKYSLTLFWSTAYFFSSTMVM